MSTARLLLPDEPTTAVGEIDWSPDGKQIVFGQASNIFVVNRDGTGKTQLTQFANGSVGPLSCSSDGQRIAFALSGALYVMKADGSELQKITEQMEISEVCWVPKSH